jgi:hypothetical protein
MSSLRAGRETIAAYVARPDDARRHAVVVVIPGNFIAELRPGRLPPLFRLGLSGGDALSENGHELALEDLSL